MNKNIRILQFLVSIIYSVQSHFSGAQTIQLNGNGIPKSITRSITGVDGNAALNISVPGNDSNLLIVFYVQIMPDDFVMQLHRF